VWREVLSGCPQTAVIGRETNVPSADHEASGCRGERAGVALARPPLSTRAARSSLSLLALAGFYRWRGSIEVHGQPTAAHPALLAGRAHRALERGDFVLRLGITGSSWAGQVRVLPFSGTRCSRGS